MTCGDGLVVAALLGFVPLALGLKREVG